VFALKLHPTLDVLVTGGRDAVARVWDMRTKHQVHCLTGHDNTVGAILTKSVDPQVSFYCSHAQSYHMETCSSIVSSSRL
jgi:WD40 repeat protein